MVKRLQGLELWLQLTLKMVGPVPEAPLTPRAAEREPASRCATMALLSEVQRPARNKKHEL